MLKTMSTPTECPTESPVWFADNYTAIIGGLKAGKTSTEIAEQLVEDGVKSDQDTPIRSYLSTRLSVLIAKRLLPDFPQLKGFTQRTTRRKRPSIAWDGKSGSERMPTPQVQTTTFEKAETFTTKEGGPGIKVGRIIESKNPSQFELAMRKLNAIDALVNSNFDETSKIKYIKAELNG